MEAWRRYTRPVPGQWLGLLVLWVALTGTAWGEEPAENATDASVAAATQEDGPAFLIDQFRPRYLREHPDLPPPETFDDLVVSLGRVEDGYVAPRPDVELVEKRLGQIREEEPALFYASAVQTVIESLRDELVARGLMGVFVGPDPLQVDATGGDLRPEDDRTFNLILTVGLVTELRTRATGDRFAREEHRIDRPEHARIAQRSPIQPGEELEPRRDLLQRRQLEEYAYHLSRHPGRMVDVGLTAADEPGGVTLDYLVGENKPWAAFAQLSNTGTRATGRFRQEFGFFHNQFTNRDDILRVQYLTASFSDLHAVAVSYDAPFPGQERNIWRYRLEAIWSEYAARDIGVFNDTFRGDSLSVGGEVSANVLQRGNFFLDAFAGLRYLRVTTTDTLPFTRDGEEDFLLPRVGLRAERRAAWYNSYAEVMVEPQFATVTNVDRAALGDLGRPSPDANWTTLQWNVHHAFFVEPLLFPRKWRQMDQQDLVRLTHELRFTFSGQHAFGDRLIPQVQQTAGGFATVRGYPEALVAGDSVLVGRFEYRLHVPQAMPLEYEPRQFIGQPFRFAPQYVYGPTDWDLVFRTFLDVGRTYRNEAPGGVVEADETLVGTGVGFDLAYRRNVRLRFDYGFALSAVESRGVERGSSRAHVVLTLLY